MKPTKIKALNKSLSKNFSFFSDFMPSLLVLAIMLIILSNPTVYSKSTISGINLFITAVLPGLFPFMFLTKILTELGTLFNLTKKCDHFSHCLFGTPGVSLFALVMSILSGYPIGAKIISDLYQKNLISETDAKKMSVFCTSSGPIFIIGAVGCGMFMNQKIGIIIYLSHIVSSIILGIIYNLLAKKKNISNPKSLKPSNNYQNHQDKNGILSKCLSDTINSLFLVGGYITIFYLLSELFENLHIFSLLTNCLYFITKNFNVSYETCKGFLYGLLEVTRGCKMLSSNINNLSIAISCGIISFSGLSIIMQSMSFLKQAKIKMHSFILSKLVHMILSMFICFLLVTLL